MDSFESLIYGILNNNRSTADEVATSQIGDYTIDTCWTNDCGWETAIRKGGGNWIIVHRYATKIAAAKGHECWCSACALNPIKVWSVQMDQYIEF